MRGHRVLPVHGGPDEHGHGCSRRIRRLLRLGHGGGCGGLHEVILRATGGQRLALLAGQQPGPGVQCHGSICVREGERIKVSAIETGNPVQRTPI